MLSRIKALFDRTPPKPELFTGVGVVLISDQSAAQLLGAPLSPADLVAMMNDVLSFQTDTVQRFGAVIDKYVGGCVVAYWPPKDMPGAVSAASTAAAALLQKKRSGRVSFSMRVSFVVAEFAVAAFGPAGRQRVQLIGRAYDRANKMQSRLLTGGVITDFETFHMLPEDEQRHFRLIDGHAIRSE